MLGCALDILLSVLEMGPANFVPKHVAKVAHFLMPCFHQALHDPAICAKLTKALALITKTWPPHQVGVRSL